MKNLLTSLKKLGKKMIGSDVTGSDLVTVVDQIADGYTGGGGGGEGGGNLIGHAVENAGDITTDICYNDVVNAIESGKMVYMTIDNPSTSGYSILSLVGYGIDPDDDEKKYNATFTISGVTFVVYAASSTEMLEYTNSDK